MGNYYGSTLAFPAGSTIGSNGYFVVAQDATVAVAWGANYVIDSAFANMGDSGSYSVRLLDPADGTVDAVGYGTVPSCFPSYCAFYSEGNVASDIPAGTRSLSRLPNGWDSGDNATDFPSSGGQLTPGGPNEP